MSSGCRKIHTHTHTHTGWNHVRFFNLNGQVTPAFEAGVSQISLFFAICRSTLSGKENPHEAFVKNTDKEFAPWTYWKLSRQRWPFRLKNPGESKKEEAIMLVVSLHPTLYNPGLLGSKPHHNRDATWICSLEIQSVQSETAADANTCLEWICVMSMFVTKLASSIKCHYIARFELGLSRPWKYLLLSHVPLT